MNVKKCQQCGSHAHVKKDCPAYKITSKFEQNQDHSCGQYYSKYYDVPVYDTHCHIDLTFSRFKHKGTVAEFMEKQNFPANFKGFITSFSDPDVIMKKTYICSELLIQSEVWATFGVHPHNAVEYNTALEEKLIQCLKHPKAVAVGECGLDYSFRNQMSESLQKDIFKRHIEIAKMLQKPIVIHSRQAENDVFEILYENNMQNWPIHIHCFTGSHSQLHRFVNAFEHMFFGFTNLVSYKTAKATHDVVRSIPLDRVLLETDAPYFVPDILRPHEQFSHPGNVICVAEEIARIKGLAVDVVLDQCRKNVRKLFNI